MKHFKKITKDWKMVDIGGATQKWMSPSNSTGQTTQDRLIFKSVRLKIAKNRFLASSDHPWQNNNV